MAQVRTVGVEEEMFLVDPETCHIRPVSARAIRADEREDDQPEELEQEIFLQQIEVNTEPAHSLSELRAHLVAGRERAMAAAESADATVIAVPTPIFAGHDGELTPKPRYQQMIDLYGEVGKRGPVCGMHVHVEIENDEQGVRILDRIQPWLPVLVALSANSPFNRGVDTSYASWREQEWDGWPSAGPVEPFGDAAGYHEAVRRLVGSEAIIDKAMVYFDVRLAENYPTVEVRVADVCTEIDDALVGRSSDPSAGRDHGVRGRTRPAVAHRAAPRRPLAGATLRGNRLPPRPARGEPTAGGRRHKPRARPRWPTRFVLPATRTLVRDGVERLLNDGGGAGRQRAAAGDDTDLDAVGQDLLRRTRAGLS